MNKTPKPDEGDYKSSLGPIPLDDFGNDIPTTDRPQSPLVDYGTKLIDEAKKKKD
jgi:hypothetical protein